MDPIVYLHGEPRVVWNEEEVDQMVVNEFVVIEKIFYGWHDIQDLRQIIIK